MTVAAYSIPELIQLADGSVSTGWAEPTGTETFGGTPTTDSDFFIQGAACISKAMASSGTGTGGALFNATTDQAIASPNALFIWMYFAATGGMDTLANGGMSVCIGSALNAYRKWYVLGNDNYAYGGWKCVPVDPNVAGNADIGTPAGTFRYFGWTVKTIAAITKGNPYGVDVIRIGRGTLQTINGDATAYGTFLGAATADQTVANRWGLMQLIDGTYVMQGHFLMGVAATAVDFRDSNRNIVIANTLKVTSGFNLFEIRNALSRVDWTNISITALGTVARGNFLVTDNADVNIDSCSFVEMGTFTLLAATAITNSTLRNCDQITAPGSDLRGTQVLTSRVAADIAAVVWNVATDTDGLLDNMTFSKGTNAHHAIELGTSSPTTVTLRGITFTGFNASNAQNDSVVHVKRTTGTVDIYTVGCSGVVSYKSDGATVVVHAASATLTVTVIDLATGAAIVGANVYVTAAAGGDLSVGTQLIKGVTNGSGVITDTRTYTASQPITGWARYAPTAGPHYKTGPIAGTVDSVNGLSTTVQLVGDG